MLNMYAAVPSGRTGCGSSPRPGLPAVRIRSAASTSTRPRARRSTRPDLDRPAFRREWLKGQSARLTWQVSPRNKVNAFSDVQSYQVRGRGSNDAPEAQTVWSFWPNGLYQATWNSPVTNKFLLEAGVSLAKNGYPYTREQVTDIFGFTVKPTDISILEASTGFRYNAKSTYADVNDQDRYVQRFSASYVTGSHAFKAGFQLQQGVLNQDNIVNEDVTYIFARGVPTTVVQWATPYQNRVRTKAELGLFVQDQWAIRRLTLNYGLRFDYFNGYVPEQHVAAARFVGARDFAAVHGVPNWKDLNPRRGRRPTTCSATAGRRSRRRSAGMSARWGPPWRQPSIRLLTSINSVTRTWADADGNYVPNCDLHEFRRQRRMRGDQQSQLRPDQSVRAAIHRRPDPRVRHPRLSLGPFGGSAASAHAARVAERRLVPQLDESVRQSSRRRWQRRWRVADRRHRQSGGDARGLPAVLHHGAGRSAVARRRRLPGVRAVRRRALRSSARAPKSSRGRRTTTTASRASRTSSPAASPPGSAKASSSAAAWTRGASWKTTASWSTRRRPCSTAVSSRRTRARRRSRCTGACRCRPSSS